jgi:hypothetical protein
MAVIILFPQHVRLLAERPPQDQPSGAVVLPFAPVRKARLRTAELRAERQHVVATASSQSTRPD